MNLNGLNLTELDKNLSEDEKREWNAVYASYRAGSMLTGRVVGTDVNTINVKNPDSGRTEEISVHSLVIISYRVKVLIPESEVWYSEQTKRPTHTLRSMAGALVDYIITVIDREGSCAVASRKKALDAKRRRLTCRPAQPFRAEFLP